MITSEMHAVQTVDGNNTGTETANEAYSNFPTFAELNYSDMLANLEGYYYQLKNALCAPGIVRYEELALLRRRVINPDLQNNRLQVQMRLATELLRLGRRTEALNLLKETELRLLQWEKPSRSLCYSLWIALILTAAGYVKEGYELATEISAKAPENNVSERLARFFQNFQVQKNGLNTAEDAA